MISEYWKKFYGCKVRLLILDKSKIRPRDGLFLDVDETHIFLEINGKVFPFLKTTIKRVELRND